LRFRHPDDSTHEPAALREFSPVYVRFGSGAHIMRSLAMSALPPKADIERHGWHVVHAPSLHHEVLPELRMP